MTAIYNSGADMWRDYAARYGDAEARGICNRYLDLQVRTTDPEELAFCRELYAAMKDTPIGRPAHNSVLAAIENARNTQPVTSRGDRREKSQYPEL